ncbi:hypothetical protein LINPERPRIM_LOCUS20829 [Linum perenne]
MARSVTTQEQFNTFHSIDRDVYAILTIILCRDPLECMQIMAFWMWIENLCISEVINTILSLPWALISALADEAAICLDCINSDVSVPSSVESTDGGIPLTVAVLDKDYISLPYFLKHRVEARAKIANEHNVVCVQALSDIMQMVIEENARQVAEAAAARQMVSSSPIGVQHIIGPMGGMALYPPKRYVYMMYVCVYREQEHGRNNEEMTLGDNRTMFATFSKGYPVVARELKEFLIRNFGADCMESLHMQEVVPPKQALYARIVFKYGSTMDRILNGVNKAKFNINGKHVWVRKYVPYNKRTANAPRSSSGLDNNTPKSSTTSTPIGSTSTDTSTSTTN